MPRLDTRIVLDEDYDPTLGRKISRFKQKKRSRHAVLDEIAQRVSLEALGADVAFNPTLGAKLHEREWIFTYLGPLYDSEYITDVLRRVKGGKEANVYLCQAHPSLKREFIAAKLYRPRMMRNLRNDARYRANRQILNSYGKTDFKDSALRAVRKGTSYGKELTHTSWLQHEYLSLQILYDAHLPVPEPVFAGDNIILMEYIGDLDMPAPALTETTLTHREAVRVRDILIDSIDRMLGLNRIHADLSAYNVLYWEGQPVIIDFPQAVSPLENTEAWDIFLRDVTRTCQYFERYNLGLNPRRLALQIWLKHQPPPDAAARRALEEMDEENEDPQP